MRPPASAAAQAPPPRPRPSPSAARAPAQCPPLRAAASLSGSRSPSAHSATGCGSSLRSVRRRSSTRRATWSWRWWVRSGRSRSCSAGRRTARRSRGSRAGASALYPSRREGLPLPLPVCCLRAAVPRFLVVSVGPSAVNQRPSVRQSPSHLRSLTLARRGYGRDQPSKQRLAEEMSDVLTHLTRLADVCGIDLAKAVRNSPDSFWKSFAFGDVEW